MTVGGRAYEQHIIGGELDAHDDWPHVLGQGVWLAGTVGVGCPVAQCVPVLDLGAGVLEVVVVAEEVGERGDKGGRLGAEGPL
jgi:hypothetical protein